MIHVHFINNQKTIVTVPICSDVNRYVLAVVKNTFNRGEGSTHEEANFLIMFRNGSLNLKKSVIHSLFNIIQALINRYHKQTRWKFLFKLRNYFTNYR